MVKMRLHILLAEHRMNQKELTEATGIRQATISAYCSNSFKYIAKSHINTLCEFFSCSVCDLITYTKDT